MTIYVAGKVFNRHIYGKYPRMIVREVPQLDNNDNQPQLLKETEIKNPVSYEEAKNIGISSNPSTMSGEGFMVKGAGMKGTRNDKLKKFINLKI